MKNFRFLTFVLAIATLLLSACGAAATTAAAPAPISTSGGNKVAMPVAFVGIVDSIAGDQWVISGTTVTVDPSIVRDGPFGVGDHIKVEGFSNPDGSFTVSRVETPGPQDGISATPSVEDNSNDANANVNDTNVNDDNSNTANSNVNDDHGTDVNSNDDNSNTANSNVNDDHGGNANSSNDNSTTVNSNDNKGGGSNSNDDKGGSGGGGNSNDSNGNGG